jgi:hypothetical protein
MKKAMRVMVMVDIREDADDEDAVREAVKEKLQEAIDDDGLDFTVEEEEEEFG